MTMPTLDQQAVPLHWRHRHLLDLEGLTPDEIRTLLDTATLFKEATDGCRRKLSVLNGTNDPGFIAAATVSLPYRFS